MVLDPAAVMANLFLYYYENKSVCKVKKADLNRTGWLFRFIDDLTAINGSGEFKHTYKEIYPPELKLKKENSGKTKGSFLDLFINIEGNKFSVNIFLQKRCLLFSTIKIPHLTSNISSKMFFGHTGQKF